MGEIYLLLARAAIAQSIGLEYDINLDEILQKYPSLKNEGASFVTITKGASESLRGCIGSLEAYRPLYEDIILNARAAALHDPRFPALTEREYDDIKVEVSILSKPKKLEYSDIEDLKKKITPFKDGIVLKLENHQATFLPQVWEQLPSFNLFFSHLCQKAALEPNCLERHPEIYTYKVEKYKEK
ncbi:MAG: AmmeMemoRadiSam system protein A [Epsilonproteobacteria bacterium]|nr:AmmeMemoRadiSam system protein A [Campylobacterota bacterium]